MTPRQTKLLKAIIDEFISTAEAVGSVNLTNRYHLGVSPATVRNEMADLVRLGYLDKPHTSSGRVPTNLAFKFFINKLLQDLDENDSSADQALYEEFFQSRFDRDRLIYKAVNFLAEIADNAAMVLFKNRVYYSGISRLVNQPEFSEVAYLRKILQTIEDYDLLYKIFSKGKGANRIKILIGEDTGVSYLHNIAMIFSSVQFHGQEQGYICVFGPNRINYYKVLPAFDFVSKSLNKVVSGW